MVSAFTAVVVVNPPALDVTDTVLAYPLEKSSNRACVKNCTVEPAEMVAVTGVLIVTEVELTNVTVPGIPMPFVLIPMAMPEVSERLIIELPDAVEPVVVVAKISVIR